MLPKPTYDELEQRLLESKKTIEGLKEREQLFHSLVENSQNMIYRMSLPDGRYEYVSPSVKNILGYSPKTFCENPLLIRDIMHPDFHSYFAKQWENLLEGHVPATYEYKIIRKDKTECWINQRNILLKNDTGHPVALEGILTDITERKRTEDLLKESKKKYQDLVETTVDSVWSLDTKGVHTYMNKSIEQLLGYTVGEITGNQFFSLMHPDDKDLAQKQFQELVDQKKGWTNLGLRFFHKDGSIRYFESSGHPIFDVDNNLIGFNGIGRDVTDRRQAEEHTKIALKEKEILLRELYHRTKNNMQVICSILSIESEDITDKGTLIKFEKIENRIKVMSLVHKKLCEAKDLSKIDLKDYIQDIGDYLLRGYKTSAKILFQVGGDSIPVLIDYAVPCGLILNELISNSLKHAFPDGKGGEILISVYELDNELEVTFRDNGIGLPKGFNLENCNSLGLGIVRDIIKGQLYGKVELEEAQGMAIQIRFDKSLYRVRV